MSHKKTSLLFLVVVLVCITAGYAFGQQVASEAPEWNEADTSIIRIRREPRPGPFRKYLWGRVALPWGVYEIDVTVPDDVTIP